MEKVYPGQFMR